jgi:ABC-type Mn2+/Zn2+ transport system ATPase subunit
MDDCVPALSVRDLTVAYRDKPVLWDIDLTVPPGVLVAIVGPNGAGKTTLIKAVLGLLPKAAGQYSCLTNPMSGNGTGWHTYLSAGAWTGISPRACWMWC